MCASEVTKVLVKGVYDPMSAPQPPNQPPGGEQQPQGPSSGPQPEQNSPFGDSPEPTQVVQPPQPQQSQEPQESQGEQRFGDSPEPTQVVQPPNLSAGEQQGSNAESTQLVPPGMQPQPAIPYSPPPSAADNPAAVNPQGFGQQSPPGGFGAPGQVGPQSGPQPQQGFGAPGQPGQQGFGAPGQPGQFGQPPQQGFGAPPGGGFGAPGQPAFGGGGNQMKAMIAGGAVALFGLIALILSITLFADFVSTSSRASEAAEQAERAYKQAIDNCIAAGMPQEQCEAGFSTEKIDVDSEGAGYAWFCIITLLVGSLAATAGGVMHALVNKLQGGVGKIVPYVTLGGGFLTLLASLLIVIEDGGAITRVIFTLILGLLITVVGVIAAIPQTAFYLGLGGSGGPGGFGGPGGPGGGFGGPGGFGQPGQPGGFGQPGGQFPSSGGFPQQGQPGQPGGFGQPGGQFPSSGGFPQQGQPGQPGGFGQPGQPPQQW